MLAIAIALLFQHWYICAIPLGAALGAGIRIQQRRRRAAEAAAAAAAAKRVKRRSRGSGRR